jgi:hypothetical protein
VCTTITNLGTSGSSRRQFVAKNVAKDHQHVRAHRSTVSPFPRRSRHPLRESLQGGRGRPGEQLLGLIDRHREPSLVRARARGQKIVCYAPQTDRNGTGAASDSFGRDPGTGGSHRRPIDTELWAYRWDRFAVDHHEVAGVMQFRGLL